MFGSTAKTPFGTGSTFGTSTSAFGQSTASPFGQTGSLFGSKPATNVFGQTPTANTGGLFGSTNTATSTGLLGGGSSVFKPSNPTMQGTSFGFGSLGGTTGQTQTNIFGTPQQAPVFGSGATSGFGTSGSLFGATAATSKPGGLFGSTATTQSSSLFGGGTTGLTTGFSGFGTSATASTGTPLKFNVVTGSDSLVKNGVPQNVSTRHQCITVMKEYESKSLEELRMEDYQAGRKGGSTTGTLTTSTAGGLFGGTATSQTAGLFGSTPGFSSGTSFGTGTSLFGQQTQQTGGLFGKSGSLFAPTSSATAGTSAFGTTGFGTTGTTGGLFGQTTSATPSLFGTTTTTQAGTGLFGATGSIFGQPASSSGTTLFGQSTFGQPAQTGGLFGAKPTGTAFGTTLGTPSTGGLFGAQKTGFNFGQIGATGLGTTGFGTGGSSSLFGSKPLGFGTNPTGTALGTGTTTGLFGATTGLGGTSALGTTGFGTAGGLGTQTASGLGTVSALGGNQNAALLAQQQQELQRQVLALTSSPFGDSPLFRNSLLDKSKVERASTTTTSTQRLGGSPSHYKVMPRPAARIKPRPINSTTMNKSKLFEGLDDDSGLSPDTFVPRRSIKKLIIKKKTGSEDSSPVAHVDGNSRLHSLEDSEELSVLTPPYMASQSPARALRTTPTRSAREGLDVVDSSESGTPIGVRFSGVTRTARLDDTIADLNVQSKQDDRVAVEDDDVSQRGDIGGVEPGTKVASISPSGRRPSEPSGITLKRPGYFCIPSVDELNSQIDEKGEIWVKDFIVAREGYGQAKFLGWTNVAGLDLDAIITFRRREIEVYPDNYTDKPAVGEELNKKAEITLEKVWPNDKSTHQPIRSPERLKLQGWQERIEKATATLGAVFYDYQMDTGKWVFTVEHFTRYGMHEELDDENALKKLKRQPIGTGDQFDVAMDGIDEEKLILLKKLREQQEKLLAYEEERQKMSSTLQHDDSERLVLQAKIQEHEEKLRAYEESRQKSEVAADRDSDMEDIGHETFPEEMLDEEDEIEQSPASHRLANSLGVNAHRMQVMKASFFGEDDHHRPHGLLRETVANESVVRESAIVEKPLAATSHTRPFQSLDSPGPSLTPRVPRIVQNTTVAGRTTDSLFGSPKIGAHPVRHAPSRFALPSSPMLLPSAIGSPFDTGIKIVGARRQRALIPKHNSLTANKEHLIADMGLTMGRSFRVGWGPGLTLAHSGRTLSKETKKVPREAGPADGMEFLVPKPSRPLEGQDDVPPFRVTLERVAIAPHLTEADRVVLDQHESALEVELNCSQWTVKDGCPMFEPCSGTRALHHHAETARKNMESLVSGPVLEEAEQASLVWDLVVALWGRLEDTEKDGDDDDDEEESEKIDRDEEINTEQRDSYESQMARREALSKWLEFAAKKRIKKEIDQTDFQERNYLRMILSYLSGRQISAACQAAQQKGDYRLALLLSQVAGSGEFRHMVRRQLEDWGQTKADKFIKDQRMRIYALLAGVMVWRMSKEEVNVCEGFDWKRCFALHLWYFCSAKSSIQDALKAYEDAFKGRTTRGKYSCAPLPPHMESSTEANENGEEEAGQSAVKPRDTCYHLLKLYCKRSHRLDRALAPSTSSARQLDYRLSWHLNQALQSLGYTHLSEYHTGALHSSFASQLENIGIWEWSVFVLLHIKDREGRECAVRDILCRHCRLSQDEEYLRKERFIREKLRVPAQWIHEAKALRARAEKCPYEEAFHLLKASHWNLGHNVILKNLASEAIVNEEYDTLKKLLGELQPRERNSTVKGWATGGQVFLDYLVLLEKVQAIAQGAQESSRIPSKYELEQIHMDVSSLCSRINHVPCATAMDRLCQSDMAKMCTNFLKLVSKELMEHEPEVEANLSTHVLAPHVNKLPMPEDCLLAELQELTAAYVTELTAV